MTCTSSLTAQLIHHELLYYASLLLDSTQCVKQQVPMVAGDFMGIAQVLYSANACCASGCPC